MRASVRAMVQRSTNSDGRVEAVNPMKGLFEKMTGTPWRNALKEKGFDVKVRACPDPPLSP